MERAEAEAIYEQGRDVVVAVLLRMDEQIQRLEKRVAQQDERITQLERRLKRSSRNSSQPPSADPPGTPPRRGKDPSGRKPGGQSGHEGKGRPLLPAWAVEEVVEHWPARCGCGHVFAEGELVGDGDPARHRVEELPPVHVVVTEHRCQRVRCPSCGRRPRGQLSADVAASALGARFDAAVAVLSVRNRISRRDVVELCEQLFGARISTGHGRRDPHPRRRQSRGALRRSACARQGGRRVEHGRDRPAHRRRAARAVGRVHQPPRRPTRWRRPPRRPRKQLLGDTSAIVTSARWWASSHLPVRRRQVCWAHLRRDFQAQAEGLDAEQEFGEAGRRICEQLFWAWEVFQHTSDRGDLKRAVRALQRQLKPLARRSCGKAPRYKRTRGLARNLLKVWPALWTFAAHDGVQPTNTHAERALRGAVIYRSSPSAANPTTANAASRDCYRRTRPAASSAAACTPTSSTRSPPTLAASPCPCWPDGTEALNAYVVLTDCRTCPRFENRAMAESRTPERSGEHWTALHGGREGSPRGTRYRSRFAAIGAYLPEQRLTTDELMASTRYETGIELERLTGVRERRVVGEGEDSATLALAAARDALAHAECDAEDLDMLIVSSISRHVGGLRRIQVEPPVSVSLKEALGARRAVSFDLSNACAGMMTGVFLLNDFVRQGRIQRGMVVSGEYISELGRNAAEEVRDVMSDQLASLTLGDAGAAAILERAPDGDGGIEVAGFTTLSEHSRLCVAFPSKIGPGTTMHTQAREIHRAGIEEAVPMLREVLDQAGLEFDQIDYMIPHQTSARAIKKAMEEFAAQLGAAPRNVVVTVDELGNTASTTHFVALSKYLNEGRFKAGDRVLLLSLASGLEVGIVIFRAGDLVERYGHGR